MSTHHTPSQTLYKSAALSAVDWSIKPSINMYCILQCYHNTSTDVHTYTYLSISSILKVGVNPSITDAYTLQILGIDRVALHNNLASSRHIMPRYKGGIQMTMLGFLT